MQEQDQDHALFRPWGIVDPRFWTGAEREEVRAYLAHLTDVHPAVAVTWYLHVVRLHAALHGPEHPETDLAIRRACSLWKKLPPQDAVRLAGTLIEPFTKLRGAGTAFPTSCCSTESVCGGGPAPRPGDVSWRSWGGVGELPRWSVPPAGAGLPAPDPLQEAEGFRPGIWVGAHVADQPDPAPLGPVDDEDPVGESIIGARTTEPWPKTSATRASWSSARGSPSQAQASGRAGTVKPSAALPRSGRSPAGMSPPAIRSAMRTSAHVVRASLNSEERLEPHHRVTEICWCGLAVRSTA